MKKLLALLMTLTLVMTMVAGCGKKEEANNAAKAKTGLAVVTSLAKSKDAGEADGLAEVDSTVVAVLVGEDGKILDCKLDVAQNKINFSKEGKLVTPLDTVFKSKQELGTEYGMKGSSAIGKEWNEQADAFAKYVVGKTVAEVKGIALNEEGKPSDADLAASVTVHINEFIAAVDKAVANAKDLGATAADKLGLGVYTDMAKSKDATAEAAGLAQAYSYYTALTVNADGKITSCAIDASQGNVNFDATGVITTDLAVAPQTKQELKEGYGMKGSSGIGKEWYEQANAYAAYITGKTLEEVNGIALTEGAPADADLKSSVTVHVTGFVEIVNKAVANAK